jgi:hypothetical protein
MQRVRRAEALDGDDRRPVVHHGQGQTGIDPPVVHVHRAGATLAVIAALLGAGEGNVLAQAVEQRRPRVHAKSMILSVDAQRDWHGAVTSVRFRWLGRRGLPHDVTHVDSGDHPGRPCRCKKRPAAEPRHAATGYCPFVGLLLRHSCLQSCGPTSETPRSRDWVHPQSNSRRPPAALTGAAPPTIATSPPVAVTPLLYPDFPGSRCKRSGSS